MNIRKIAFAGIAVFAGFSIMDFIIHGVILARAYQALPNLWRSDMQSKMWIMSLATLIMSVMFVVVFAKGYENKGIAEGARYGIIIGLLINVAGAFNQYVIYPMPFVLAVKWFIFGMIEFILCGIIASLAYKPENK